MGDDDFVIGILGGSVAGLFAEYSIRNPSRFESLRDTFPTFGRKTLRIVNQMTWVCIIQPVDVDDQIQDYMKSIGLLIRRAVQSGSDDRHSGKKVEPTRRHSSRAYPSGIC